MKIRFFRYSGNKFKYTELINPIINSSTCKIYVEPFIGSGAILFNLEKEFDKYVINDIDRNVIRIYKTFKEIDYSYYIKELKFLEDNFGNLKTDKNNKIDTPKENYYNFRNWFNENHWNSDTIKEGIYLYFLANSCINSLLRFGPNGMNQSFGNRFYKMDELSFNSVKSKLEKVEIHNKDYKEILKLYPSAFYFLDPPYFSQKSSYQGFNENEFKEFLELIKDKNYVYTDILNEYNSILENRKLAREMNSTSPLGDLAKRSKNGNMEYVFSNLNKKESSMELFF